jgi:nucleoside 2-deoxyribosyltransferase
MVKRMNNIYIASSWKNVEQVRALAARLRESGFQVDDFTDDRSGRFVFHYSELGSLEQLDAISFLKHDKARQAFVEDKKMIDWADAVVLLLPAGRSAHLEAGYAKGSGKRLVIYQPDRFPPGEFDVMYGFADLITTSFEDVVVFLKGGARHGTSHQG